MGCKSLEEARIVAYKEGNDMDKKTLGSNSKTENSQVYRLTEPGLRFVRSEIIDLLFKALLAEDIWKAMEYLMAARGLLGNSIMSIQNAKGPQP